MGKFRLCTDSAVIYSSPYSHLHEVQRYALVVAVLRLSTRYYGKWNSRLFGDDLRTEPARQRKIVVDEREAPSRSGGANALRTAYARANEVCRRGQKRAFVSVGGY